MTKKMLAAGFVSLLVMTLSASPALAKHRHAFEGGFQDELGRIGAHAAVNLGVNFLGALLNGSGLAYGAGGFPYGGPGLINRGPAYYYPPQSYYPPERRIIEERIYYPPVERRIIEKRIYIYRDYPRYYRHYHDDDCDYDD